MARRIGRALELLAIWAALGVLTWLVVGALRPSGAAPDFDAAKALRENPTLERERAAFAAALRAAEDRAREEEP